MSPSPSPSSSAGSPPDSSPADTTFSDTSTTRPSFVPLTLPPLSQIPLSSESFQALRTHEQLPPPILSTSETAAITRRRGLRHAHSVSEDESENAQGTSSHPSPQTGKKKRTRTLTTPYQSAVLHALLAQSRFPTTAMREEVGRSIGLSARKVQVWFQNQRQKARKPRSGQGRSDSVDPPQPPAQFGPFNPVPSGDSMPVAGSSSSLELSGKSSVFSDELSASDSMRGGAPVSAVSVGGSSTSMDSEFHMGPSHGHHGSSSSSSYEQQQKQFHPDFRVQHATIGGGGAIPLKIETSPDSLRSGSRPEPSRLEGSTPSRYSYYSPLSTTTSRPLTSDHLMSQGPSSSRFAFTASGESPSPGPPDSLSNPPITLPPLRLNNLSLMSMESEGSETHNPSSSARPDPQLRYSASLPSFSQESSAGGGRGVASGSRSPSFTRSVPVLPPPFTLQPRPQWHWDRPLGVVLPTIGIGQQPPGRNPVDVASGLRHYWGSSLNAPSPRPRTTSDPALPPLETRRSALLTEPWPLPLPPCPIGQHQQPQPSSERLLLQHEAPSSGGKSSTETLVISPSHRSLDMDSQQEHRSSGFPLIRTHPMERSRAAAAQPFLFAEEDRMRRESATPRPSLFRP